MFDRMKALVRGAGRSARDVVDDAIREGQAALARGDLDAAEAALRRAIAHEPPHAGRAHAQRALASVLSSRGDRRGAIDALRAALAGGFSGDDAWHELCFLLHGEGDPAGARDAAMRGIEAFPASAALRASLGNLRAFDGDFAGAAGDYERAVALAPPSAELCYNLAIALGRTGRRADAMARYRQAIEIDPSHVAAHINLANALREDGSTRDALAHFERAVALAPDSYLAHFGAAGAYQASGDLDRALAAARRALSLAPDDPRAHTALGNVLLERGDTDDAIAAFREALRRTPGDIDALMRLGNAHLKRGDASSAVERYREVLAIDPANPVAHLVTSLTGGTSERAPDRYVARLFDEYADRFDAHLVKELRYEMPRRIADMLAVHAAASGPGLEALDLGCGTGLVGVAIAPFARRIVGVDLSPGMIAKARATGRYARLETAELVAMMRSEPDGSYDLVTAADVFVYVGRLDEAIVEIARLLRPGGLVACSVESLDALPGGDDAQVRESGYRLNGSGRYAHRLDYLDRLARNHGFAPVEHREVTVRLDRGNPIEGYVVLWRAPGPPGEASAIARAAPSAGTS